MPDINDPVVDPPKQPIPRFRIVCETCGGDDIQVQNNMQRGSEETGTWGSIDLYCRACGNRAAVHDT